MTLLPHEWIKLNDHAVAVTMNMLRKTTNQVTAAIRREGCGLLHGIGPASSQYLHCRRTHCTMATYQGSPCPKIAFALQFNVFDLGDEMIQHFEKLEAGTTLPMHEIRDKCISRKHTQCTTSCLRSPMLICESFPHLLKQKTYVYVNVRTRHRALTAFHPMSVDMARRLFHHTFMKSCSRPFSQPLNRVDSKGASSSPFGSRKDLKTELNPIVGFSSARPLVRCTMHG